MLIQSGGPCGKKGIYTGDLAAGVFTAPLPELLIAINLILINNKNALYAYIRYYSTINDYSPCTTIRFTT